jgi:hypothetical protein
LSAAWRLKKGTKKRPNMVQKPYLVAHQVTQTIFGGSSGNAHYETDNFNQSQGIQKK